MRPGLSRVVPAGFPPVGKCEEWSCIDSLPAAPPFALRTLSALRCYGPGALGRRAPEEPEKGPGEAWSVEEREGKTAATRMSSRHVDTSRLSVEQCWALDDEDDADGGRRQDAAE